MASANALFHLSVLLLTFFTTALADNEEVSSHHKPKPPVKPPTPPTKAPISAPAKPPTPTPKCPTMPPMVKKDVPSSCKACKYTGVDTLTALAPAPATNPSYEVGGFTFIEGAAAKGALCLDGSVPAYHFRVGFGSGANNWLVDFEGGGWCNDIESCVGHKKSHLGSTINMKRVQNFTGIMSNRAEENPDFFNWNMVKLRYCDGASFAGEGENKVAGLLFRGQRIFRAAMDELMSRGMRHADKALLSGGSAGGVAVILQCDAFSRLFPKTTRVKCFSDAGLFMDTVDVSGGYSMRSRVHGVVSLQGVESMLPQSCVSRLGPDSCFFPQHLINYVKTPLFILNAGYDWIQVQAGIAPNHSDPYGKWNNGCKLNFTRCSTSQIHTLQGFRKRMVRAVKGFGATKHNGVFINACFAHCQAYDQVTWISDHGPKIGNEGISAAVGDWYFDRAKVKKIGCPYPCEKTCHNDVLTQSPY